MRAAQRRGAALILVLWLVAGLALVVAASARSVGGHVRLATVELERLRAEALLDGAIALVAQHLRNAPDGGTAYRVYRLTLGAEVVDIEVTPAKGLVDVNVASDELLQALLRTAGGSSPGEAMALASRIRDWIDPDDQPGGIGGAEAAQYRAAGWPSLPRNAAVEDDAELLAVMGVTPDLYEKIRPFLGVNGGQRIDIGAAPPDLIDRLTGRPGLGVRLHGVPADRREAELAPYTASAVFEHRPGVADRAVRLIAHVVGPEGRRWQRRVWIDRAERPDTLTPWTTLVVEPTRRSGGPGQDMNP